MRTGRLNLIFGWVWLLFSIIMGIYLQVKMHSGPEWMNSPRKMFWSGFHTHGGFLAIVNILYNYGINHVKLRNIIKSIGSALMILGTILFSGGLYLAGIQKDLIKIARPGPWLVVLGIVILIIGLLGRQEEKHG